MKSVLHCNMLKNNVWNIARLMPVQASFSSSTPMVLQWPGDGTLSCCD